jgi:hypothetical protein
MTKSNDQNNCTAKRSFDEDGGTTIDLLRRYPRLPGRRQTRVDEIYVQARGKWLMIGGGVTTALVLAISVIWNTGFDDMPDSYLLPAYFLSLGAIAIGCLEYLNRPSRRAQRHCLDQIGQVRGELLLLVSLLDEKLKQRFYEGAAQQERDSWAGTGTENARRIDARAEVLDIRSKRHG